jgi:TolB-like protein
MAALGRLDHPNVVRATDAGEANGVAFLVMDLVDGMDLDRLVRATGPLRVADACELARQAAAGLQHLAAHGLVHRDVKPSNLMLSRRGEVQILDLGLATTGWGHAGDALTGTGQVVGTFDYLAPEQADVGRPVDTRADVYGLGCTLFYLLAARPPYAGAGASTPRAKILAHTAGPVPEARDLRPDVPEGLSAVLRRMLAKDPADRFPTPAGASEALAPYCTGSEFARLLASVGLDPLPQAHGGLPHEPKPRPGRPAAGRRPLRHWVSRAAVVLATLAVGGGLTAAVRVWVLPASGPKGNTPGPPAPNSMQSEPAADAATGQPVAGKVHPVALLGFEERGAGAKDLGPKVGDLLFAKLAAKPALYLVDRADLKKVLDEQLLGRAGAVKADEAAQVGQLTGAKLLVTGSVVQADKKLYLVAKLIGTETGRVAGASVEGAQSDDLGTLVGKLADAVADAVEAGGDRLVPRPAPAADRAAELSRRLGKAARPALMVQVGERHVGAPAVDPAAQTELGRIAKEAGFELVDPEEGAKGKADVLVTGEGFSEVAGRVGGLVSVRARVEVKAVDRRTGRVLAVDRQTAVVVDASEQVAGKQALQDAAAALAERVLPKVARPDKK